LHYETSFETVTGKKQNGDYLPLIPANNWSNTIRTEFRIKNWFEAGYATLNFTSTFNQIMLADLKQNPMDILLVNLGLRNQNSVKTH
jgi:iron complex outermembrane receptor protein